MRKIFAILTTLSVAMGSYGQIPYTDPTRAATIELFSQQTKKTLNAQEAAQLVMTGMHVYVKEEVEATTNFQREFNEYLDQFNDVISIAAEVYGLYNEISKTASAIKELSNVLSSCPPTNMVAAAMIPRRRQVYERLIKTGMDIASDIHKVCFSDTKMTEKERLKVILAMRPKLRTANRDIRRVTLFIRYTNFLDVWNEINGGRVRPKTRAEIIEVCQRRWRSAYHGRRGSGGGEILDDILPH